MLDISNMDKSERDKYVARIKKFVKRNKKGHLKSKLDIYYYLMEQFPCTAPQHIDFFGTFNRLYGNRRMDLFSAFTVHIYFPYENMLLVCSYTQAKKIPYIQALLNNNFAEEIIKYKYILHDYAFDGPLLIISMALTNSILLENGKTLQSQFKEI